jgi:hypothetical protein
MLKEVTSPPVDRVRSSQKRGVLRSKIERRGEEIRFSLLGDNDIVKSREHRGRVL